MSMIVLLMAACGEQASPESERPLWPVGFRVAEVDELPRGNWIEHWPYESVYAIASTAEGLEVSFSSSDGYVHPRVRLRLTPSGARAQASYGDCTSIWNGDSIALGEGHPLHTRR